MRLNVKTGTYANTTTARALAAAGTATSRIWWRGYKTTAGDQDNNNVAVEGIDIPLITFTTVGLTVSGAHHVMSNMSITGAKSGSGQVAVTAIPVAWYRCRFANTNTAASSFAFQQQAGSGLFVGCYFTAAGTTTTPVVSVATQNQNQFYGCYFSGGTGGFAATTATGTIFYFCIFDSIPGDAITFTTGGGAVVNCIIYAPTGNGINVTGVTAVNFTIANNIFSTVNQASKAAINNTSGTNTDFITPIANGYYNCTANRSGLTEDFNIFDVGTLASDPFVNAAGHDFTLNPVAKALGFPGLFENISAFQGYLDLGAVQRIEPAGGLLIPQGFSGGYSG